MGSVLRKVHLIDVVNGHIKENANIVIDGDTIVDIFYKDSAIDSDQHEIIDLEGCFALPGLIDLHTHLIWSGGSDPVRVVEEEGIQLSLLHAALNARKTLEAGGHDPFWGEQADGPAELIKAVRKQVLRGAKVIKVSATGGVYGQQNSPPGK